MVRTLLLAFTCSLLLGFFPSSVRPEESSGSPRNPWSLQLGAATRVAPLYQGSSKYGLSVFPFLRVSYDERFSLGPEGLRAQVRSTDSYVLNLGLVYHPGRDDVEESDVGGVEDDRLEGLGDADGTVGTRLEISTRNLPVTIEASVSEYWGGDVGGRKATVRFSRTFPLRRRLLLIPGVGLEWADREYRETFFGVTGAQASRTEFNRFRAKSGLNQFDAGVRVRLLLSSDWAFRGGIRGSRLLGDAADSPITRKKTNASFLFGFVRRF